MWRLVLLIVIAWLAFELIARSLRAVKRRSSRGGSVRSGSGRGAKPPAAHGGELVRCDACGVHVPARSSVRGGRRVFCSEACRRAGAGDP